MRSMKPKKMFLIKVDNIPYICHYFKQMQEIIQKETGSKVYTYICTFLNPENPDVCTLSTTTIFNVLNQPQNRYKAIINLKRINDIRRINKFFEAINQKLPIQGIFIGCAETFVLRKQRIKNRYIKPFGHIAYFFDFIYKRVFPKLPFTKKLYFFLTRGRNRVLSRAETLGRLYSCGFKVEDERFIEGKLFFVAQKIKKPYYDNNPSYGPFFKMRRVGKNGKTIYVYKLRTMHAYSEYLQEYVYEKYNLDKGGKFKNDFRITNQGRFFRKFWLDELPMLINLLKGDLKIVGVRPLSQHYLSLYKEELRQKRLKTKPGLIPPYYVDMPKAIDEIMASEHKYLEKYEKRPFITDISYFFKALYNIIFKKARSK